MEKPDKTNPDDTSTTPAQAVAHKPNLFTTEFEKQTKKYNIADNLYKRPIFAEDDTATVGKATKIYQDITEDKDFKNFFENIKDEIQQELDQVNAHYKIMDVTKKIEFLIDLKNKIHTKLEEAFKDSLSGKSEAEKNKLIADIDARFKAEIDTHAINAEKMAVQRAIRLLNELNPDPSKPPVTLSSQLQPEALNSNSNFKMLDKSERSRTNILSPTNLMFENWLNLEKSVYAKFDGKTILLEARPVSFWLSNDGRKAIRRQLLHRIAQKGFKAPLEIEAKNLGTPPESDNSVLAIMYEEAVKLGFDPDHIKGFTPDPALKQQLIDKIDQDNKNSNRLYSNITKEFTEIDAISSKIIQEVDNIDDEAKKVPPIPTDQEIIKKHLEQLIDDQIMVSDKNINRIDLKDKIAHELFDKIIDELEDKGTTSPSNDVIQTALTKKLKELSADKKSKSTQSDDSSETELTNFNTSEISKEKKQEAYKEILTKLEQMFSDVSIEISDHKANSERKINDIMTEIKSTHQEIAQQVEILIKLYDSVPTDQFTIRLANQYKDTFKSFKDNLTDLTATCDHLKTRTTDSTIGKKIEQLKANLELTDKKVKKYQEEITTHIQNGRIDDKPLPARPNNT